MKQNPFFNTTISLLLCLPLLISCELGSTDGFNLCGVPSTTKQTLEIWSIRTNGDDLRLEYDGWKHDHLYFELIGANSNDSTIYLSPSYSDDGLYSINDSTNTINQLFEMKDVKDFKLSPTNTQIVFVHDRNELWTYSFDENSMEEILNDSLRLRNPVWSKEEKRISIATYTIHIPEQHKGGVKIFNFRYGKAKRVTIHSTTEYDISKEGFE